MDRETYALMAHFRSQIPAKKETLPGQKFHIREIVKCNNPRWSNDKDGLYEIQYTYAQKYGGDDIKNYSLKHLFEDNSSSWYDESELELIKGIDEINEEHDISEYKRLKEKYG